MHGTGAVRSSRPCCCLRSGQCGSHCCTAWGDPTADVLQPVHGSLTPVYLGGALAQTCCRSVHGSHCCADWGGGRRAQTYCQPVYELCDKTLGDILAPVWSLRNVAVRLVCRTVFICVCAFIGMMVRGALPCQSHAAGQGSPASFSPAPA